MDKSQPFLFNKQVSDKDYLSTQLITYIGNKRTLLPFIKNAIILIKSKIQKEKIDFLDLFSGTGIVSRMVREHANIIHCNDLEKYSEITNRCYQTNQADINDKELTNTLKKLNRIIENNLTPGFIYDLYSPKNDQDIQYGERVFYTNRNAIFLDTFCQNIHLIPEHLYPYILAPILSQASMYVNTSGVFKGFYKNKNGLGQFGGTSENALSRIKKNIQLKKAIFSIYPCKSFIHRCDANKLLHNIDPVDIAYFDPPYNQHPYGSNYFMLNLLCDYKRPDKISKVSGIPTNWNRSFYNKPKFATKVLMDAVENVKAKFVLISYNSEGFIKREEFLSELSHVGEVSVMDTRYNTFKGCRNLSDRNIYVTENLYLIDKR